MDEDRAQEYLTLANRLRAQAAASGSPEVKAELNWLALGYERLAAAPELRRIVDGFRSLEIPPFLSEEENPGGDGR